MRVLLLAQKSIYADVIIRKFCELREVEIVGLVYSNVLFSGKANRESLKMAIKKGGAGMIFGKFIDTIFSQPSKMSFPFPVFKTGNVNSGETVKKITQLKPEIIFSVYFNQIIGERVISIPKRGIVNIHPSYLPKYRGVGPTFWVLANNEKETGVSYHFITLSIDAGDVIKREIIPIYSHDSVHSLYLRISMLAAQMLPSVIGQISAKRVTKDAQDESQASYFGIPDREGYRRFRNNKRRFITFKDIISRIRFGPKAICGQ